MSTETHRAVQWPVYRVSQDGCKWSPSCFICPLPECKYDVTDGVLHLNVQEKHQNVLAALEEGLTVAEAAERFSYTKRTIRKIKQKAGE